ncbi:hypothetical protein RQP46_010340 [Phenoliferia psychrophenolica]
MAPQAIQGHAILSHIPSGPLYLREQIGTGGTSTVWRALLPGPPQQFLAVKIVRVDNHTTPIEQKKVDREFRIHQTLRHQHILEIVAAERRGEEDVMGERWSAGLYIAMQLAAGGDLFDMIAPDVGVQKELAHMFLKQLIAALVRPLSPPLPISELTPPSPFPPFNHPQKYLGKQGICHRDIKPENILLTGKGDLKVSDFGLASVYKYKGQERKLTDRCGSPPYAAPELAVVAPYDGPPVDVWSAGIVFFTLLVGNTPWDEPTSNSPEFVAYQNGTIWAHEPWDRISANIRPLLQGMLHLTPSSRWTIPQIEADIWFKQTSPLLDSATGLARNGAAVHVSLATTMREKGLLGAPSQAYEELCGQLQSTNLQDDSEAAPSASQAYLSQRNLDPSATFQSSMKLYSVLSMAPSQAASFQPKRFFSTLPLSQLVPLLSTTLSATVPFWRS